MRLNLDEGHIVDEQAGEQCNGRRRKRKDLQKLDGVRLDERYVDGDVGAGAQAQECFQDANDGAPVLGTAAC